MMTPFKAAIFLLFAVAAAKANAAANARAHPDPRARARARPEPRQREARNIQDFIEGGHNHQGHNHNQLDADDPDFTGIVDFSNAEPGPGGSWCITKTKFVDHMVKDQIKECWHQNVTQCHDTYVTEFLPSQEQKCEESFWKSCKIDFREMPYNYTMKQCHTPLVKMCDSNPSYGKPEIVCKTWFESECNTTYTETTPNVEDKPNTWCKKVPRKICAPDNCKMVAGPEECNDKMLVSTIQKPTEICDLQPQQHCRLITKLTPHLLSKEVCKNIPKEVCHLALSAPKQVRKPLTLKWCTRNKQFKQQRQQALQSQQALQPQAPPTYKPSYLPPPPPGGQRAAANSPSPSYAPPTYGSQTRRPINNFQQHNQAFASAPRLQVTKFKPKRQTIPEIAPKVAVPRPERPELFQAPEIQEKFQPAASIRSSQSIQVPEAFRRQVVEVFGENAFEKALEKAVETEDGRLVVEILDDSTEEQEEEQEKEVAKALTEELYLRQEYGIPAGTVLGGHAGFSASFDDGLDISSPGMGSFTHSGNSEYSYLGR